MLMSLFSALLPMPASLATSTSSYSHLEIWLGVTLWSKTFDPWLPFRGGARSKSRKERLLSLRSNLLLSGVFISLGGNGVHLASLEKTSNCIATSCKCPLVWCLALWPPIALSKVVHVLIIGRIGFTNLPPSRLASAPSGVRGVLMGSYWTK